MGKLNFFKSQVSQVTQEQKEIALNEILNIVHEATQDGPLEGKYAIKIKSLIKDNSLDTLEVKDAISKEGLKRLKIKMEEAIQDSFITDKEYAELQEFASSVYISNNEFKKLIKEYKSIALHNYIKSALDDGKLTSSEKHVIEQLRRESKASEQEVKTAIAKAKAEYSAKESKRKKDNKKQLLRIAMPIVAAFVIIILGFITYSCILFPNPLKHVSIAPNPVFDINHIVYGKLSGIVKQNKSRDIKYEITPYIFCRGNEYPGETFVLQIEEPAASSDVNTIVTKQAINYNQTVQILNPTYGKKMKLRVKTVVCTNKGRIREYKKSVATIYATGSITDTYEMITSPWETLADIFGGLLVLAVILTIIGFKSGWFMPIQIICIALAVVSLILLIIPMIVLNYYESKKDVLFHTYENTKEIVDLYESMKESGTTITLEEASRLIKKE